MTTIAFAGPSLPPPDRVLFPGIEWRAPAQAGDLLRLAEAPPQTICLIDGWFDHRPAVRHKELLLLLSLGVRIHGAASIGALRAAEMAPFGMIGEGAIFRAFAAGRLTGDDEVALVHGPAEWGWKPLSIPLVDVRATLCRAARMRALERSDLRALLEAAKAIHYADRSWEAIAADVLAPAPAEAFRAWLGRFALDQKRADARACLEAAAAPLSATPARPEAVLTGFLERLADRVGVALPRPAPGRKATASSPTGRAPGTDCGTISTP